MHLSLDAKVVDQIGISQLLYREATWKKMWQEVREQVLLGQVAVRTPAQFQERR